MQRGFFLVPVLLVIIIGAISVGIFAFNQNKNINESPIISPTLTPEPDANIESTPSITAAASPTNKIVPSITKNPPTKTPTPKATEVVSQCSKFKPEDGLATVTINLKEKDGKALVGDWIVTLKPDGACPATLPYGNQPIQTVVKQGTYTYTSPGFNPGQVRIDVSYHYTGEGFGVDAVSGNHVREVTVAN